MRASFRTTPVYAWNYRSPARVKINQGGTSSGKTYAILQVIFMRLIDQSRIATVVGQDIPNLKKGALRDFQERILVDIPWMNEFIESYNKSERIYRFKNGSILEFTSFSDWQDAKNGKRNIAFFNEANGIDYQIYEQVAMRTSEEIFIDYNPSEEFWAHDSVMSDPKSVTFYSNFTHNPFVDAAVREYILGLKAKSQEMWDVYGLGKTGSLTETIFKDVTIVDKMPEYLRYLGYGMDFGYSNDPTTLYRCGLQNQNEVFIDELIYMTGLQARDMNKRMTDLSVSPGLYIYADASEPRLIDDLRDYGWRVLGATKGAGSIEYGISLLQDYKLHITETSYNILNEQKKYKFKLDKKTNKVLNQPIDAWNHGWDAVRYWAIMNLKPLGKRRKGVSGG